MTTNIPFLGEDRRRSAPPTEHEAYFCVSAPVTREEAGSRRLCAFVFTRNDGRPLSRSIVDKAWARLNERAGVPSVRFHDLRHTAATLLLGRGVNPKIVSEMMGHSTVAITLDIYSHVTPTMQREAAVAMDDLLAQ